MRALIVLLSSLAVFLGGAIANAAAADITVEPHDLSSGSALSQFTYIVNVDNAHLGNAADPTNRPFVAPTESFSPIVAEGDQDHATASLPSDCTGKANASADGAGCRYLISVRSPDHKMWGKHIRLGGASPDDAGVVR